MADPDSPAMTASPTIRSLGPTVYLPTFLFAVGQGAVLPVIALTAIDLGASVATAGVLVSLQGIGRMLFNVPAGRLVDGLGERRAMAVGTGILLLSLVGCVLSPSPAWFGVCLFAMGCGWSVWLLARLTYVSEVMPYHLRGRALSTLGGVHRVGNFAGPFLGALAIAAVGLAGVYHVHLALAVAGLAVLLALPDPHHRTAVPAPVGGLVAVARDHAGVLATAGFGAASLGVLRAARHAVLPLWGAQVGLDATAVSLIFGITAGLDMTLFYPAGAVSDRWGRTVVAVPCLALLAVGFVLLPLTATFTQVLAVGLLMGFGNGLGSGIIMTLGADFAPAQGRAAFLGLWRTVSDVGAAAGPILAGGVAGVATLGAASVVVGGVGLAGAVVFGLTLPRHPPAPAG
jgi:MFS family permease